MNNSICILLSTIKNAGHSYKRTIKLPYTVSAMHVCAILYKNGYITYYKKTAYTIEVGIKYFNNIPLIREIKIFSTPSRRLFATKESLTRDNPLNDFLIVSTKFGYMTSLDAYAAGVGGQLICKIN